MARKNDFYDTSFSIDENFYQIDVEEKKNPPKTIRKKEKRDFKKILILVGVIILVFLLFLILYKGGVFNKKKIDEPQMVLKEDTYKIKVLEKYILVFELINAKEEGTVTFQSSNTEIATVSSNGEVTGVKDGDAVITIIYKTKESEIKKNVTFTIEKENGSSNQNSNQNNNQNNNQNKKLPSLTLSFLSYKENTWTNKNVVLKTSAKSNTDGSISLKYTINCNSNCKYTEVKNNQITISNNGTNVVSVVATDRYNNQATKSVTVKIDKTAPKVTLSPNNSTITSKTDVTVCASCQDDGSKCKQDRVCKTYTKTTYNETLTVEDNASNKTTSNAFSVVINRDIDVTKVTLNKTSLTLNKDGSETLKATIAPTNATNKTITWSSSNSKVATVTSAGVVKGINPGSATITAKSNNNKTATCKVTVCGWTSSVATNQVSCTAVSQPTTPKEGSTYVNCEVSGYSKYRYILYDKNNKKSYSGYIYDTPSVAVSACKKAGGVTCHYERYRLYTKTSYVYKCS